MSSSNSSDDIANQIACIMECTGCGFKTDVYSVADLDMWKSERLLFPDCPVCRKTLKKAKKQYAELDIS